MITVLSVKEMCCPVEGRAVEKALRAMEGVEEILFDYAARTVRVTHGTVAVEALVREVEKLGMTACFGGGQERSPGDFDPRPGNGLPRRSGAD